MKRLTANAAVPAALLALALASCAKESPVANNAAPMDEGLIANAQTIEPPVGAIDLMGKDGETLGKVQLADVAGALQVTLTANGVGEGEHGIHLHAAGTCDAPDFKGADAHLNPEGKAHGRDNPAGAHLGDLPNLAVDKSGTGSATFTIPGLSVEGLKDADGTALVLHEKRDDGRTDPSGDSGARIACAVLAAPK